MYRFVLLSTFLFVRSLEASEPVYTPTFYPIRSFFIATPSAASSPSTLKRNGRELTDRNDGILVAPSLMHALGGENALPMMAAAGNGMFNPYALGNPGLFGGRQHLFQSPAPYLYGGVAGGDPGLGHYSPYLTDPSMDVPQYGSMMASPLMSHLSASPVDSAVSSPGFSGLLGAYLSHLFQSPSSHHHHALAPAPSALFSSFRPGEFMN